MIYFFISIFFLFYLIRSILFWLYLWQLKEYHLGRFIDHFRTEKGKRIFLSFFPKFFLILIFFFLKPAFLILFFVFYFLQFFKIIFDLFKKNFKFPVFTKKIIFLSFFCLAISLFYFFSFFQKLPIFLFYLLIFDLFSPAIFSGIIISFQPLTVFWRYRIIKRAIEKREKFKDLIVIGITGSYGKTSTKEFLAKILSEKFKVLKTKEHQNSEFAISKFILEELKDHHQILVVEMGAYNKGGIKLLSRICQPRIGIITGVNEQHLATFGSMENLISAEGGEELVESLPKNGLSIFNGNNRYCIDLYQKIKIPKKIISTFNSNADVWVDDVKIEKESISFKAISKDGDFSQFKLNLLGAQNIENLLLAICCAKELGMKMSEISIACQKIKYDWLGMKLIKTKAGINIIDSTYSANPTGVIAHLDYLKIWPRKKVIVMPCLIELGSASKKIHKRIGEKIGEVCDLAIITTKDKFEEIRKGAQKSGMPKEKILFLEKPKQIFKKIKEFCQKEDVILLEGRIPREVMTLFSE